MRTKLKFAVVAALLMLLGPLAASAYSEPPDSSGIVTRGDGVLVYGYWSDGLLVLTGLTAEEFCQPPIDAIFGPRQTVIDRPNEGIIGFVKAGVPVSVYEYSGPELSVENPSGGFDLLVENCGAIVDGDPATVPIEPLATGEAELRVMFRATGDGSFDYHSSTVGTVVTADGGTAQVNTFEQLLLGGDVFTLEEVSQIRVNYTG